MSWTGSRIVVNVIGSVTTGRCTFHVTEAHALATTVEELEEYLEVQDVADLEELSESMCEGLATIRHTDTQLREKTRSHGYVFMKNKTVERQDKTEKGVFVDQ